VDVEQAYAVGQAAVRMALAGKSAVMPVIKRIADKPYRWRVDEAPLDRVANKEKKLPRKYIAADGFGITAAARRYLSPLIQGEDYPPYINGLPNYVRLKNVAVPRKLGSAFVV
jgi:6-phosphofructokinase 1